MAHNLIAGLLQGSWKVGRGRAGEPVSSQVCLWPQMKTNQGAIYVH